MCKQWSVFVTILAVLWAYVSPVLACSGGSSLTLTRLVDEADVIVRGQLEVLDDAGQNGVMRVSAYLKGGPGPAHILLSLHPPAQIEAIQERYSGGGCFYGVSPALQTGEEIVIFLQRKVDGSFMLAPRHFSNPMYYPFPRDHSPIRVFLNAEGHVFTYDENRYSAITADSIPLTVGEFAAHITEVSGQQVQSPLEDRPYPLFAPLLLTTTAGSRYLLPVDGSEPLALTLEDMRTLRRYNPGCHSIDCAGFSPNGIDNAFLHLLDNNPVIRLTYREEVQGDAFLFSSTGDALAVWVIQHDLAQIQVYTLRYSRLRIQDHEAIPWRSIDLHRRDEWMRTTGQAAWSPDGRRLAFSDARGVWLWDVFTSDSEPELLTDEQMIVEDWSATGRYLSAWGTDGEVIIDLMTNERLPAGALSPDDRILLTYEPEFRVLRLTPYHESANFVPVGSHVRKAIWKNSRQYIALTCPDEADRDSCRVVEGAVAGVSGGTYTGYDFDYKAVGDSLAIIQNDMMLLLRSSTHRTQHQYERDLSAVLDAPLVAVEWLPSLLYAD